MEVTVSMATSLHNLKLVFSTLTLEPLRKKKTTTCKYFMQIAKQKPQYSNLDPG